MKSDLQVTSPITISIKEARQFLLDHHFLLPPKNLTIKQKARPDPLLSPPGVRSALRPTGLRGARV